MDTLETVARAIIYQRDYRAENGDYDYSQLHPDEQAEQEFDDWAADLLEQALTVR